MDEHHIADLRPHFDPDEASGTEAVRLAGAASTDGLVGGAAGTALGLVTRVVALAILRIGPAVGAGIWAYALGGGAVGVASGFVAGSLVHRWEVRYRDLVDVGRVLVGAHVDDRSQAKRRRRAQSFPPRRRRGVQRRSRPVTRNRAES